MPLKHLISHLVCAYPCLWIRASQSINWPKCHNKTGAFERHPPTHAKTTGETVRSCSTKASNSSFYMLNSKFVDVCLLPLLPLLPFNNAFKYPWNDSSSLRLHTWSVFCNMIMIYYDYFLHWRVWSVYVGAC